MNSGLSCQFVPSLLYSQPVTVFSVMLFFVASAFVGAAGASGVPLIFNVIVSVPLVLDCVIVVGVLSAAAVMPTGYISVSKDNASTPLKTFLYFILHLCVS